MQEPREAAPIDLVIFDCDGVLVDSEKLSGTVLIEMLAAIGTPIDFNYFCQNCVGRSFPTVAKNLADQFGTTLGPDFETTYRARLMQSFTKDLTVTRGLPEFLSKLPVASCVATSSSPERVDRSLGIVGLRETFAGRIFTASQVSRGKPAPDLFLLAAKMSGADPARCLVIEDSMPGVDAALAAGMDLLRYTGGAHLRGRKLRHPAHVETFDEWSDIASLRPNLFAEPAYVQRHLLDP